MRDSYVSVWLRALVLLSSATAWRAPDSSIPPRCSSAVYRFQSLTSDRPQQKHVKSAEKLRIALTDSRKQTLWCVNK